MIFPRPLGRRAARQHLDFSPEKPIADLWPPECKITNSCCAGHQVCDNLLEQPQEHWQSLDPPRAGEGGRPMRRPLKRPLKRPRKDLTHLCISPGGCPEAVSGHLQGSDEDGGIAPVTWLSCWCCPLWSVHWLNQSGLGVGLSYIA